MVRWRFSSDGCETERGGLNSELYLLRDGAWAGSICRNASDWPRGSETRRLFAEIESHFPGVFDEFLKGDPHEANMAPRR
jgi:hypothetical protein